MKKITEIEVNCLYAKDERCSLQICGLGNDDQIKRSLSVNAMRKYNLAERCNNCLSQDIPSCKPTAFVWQTKDTARVIVCNFMPTDKTATKLPINLRG